MNPDIWEEEVATEDDGAEEILARAKFIHRTFKQNEEGRQMLEDMVNETIRRPIVHPGDSQFAAGIREGKAAVVRMLLDQIEYAENN